MSKKSKQWILPRHRRITYLAKPIISMMCHKRYNIDIDKGGFDRQCVILYNHQTPYDQFFVGLTFNRPLYYIATEDIFSLGWVSRLLEFAVAPIPIKKSARDMKAIKTCIQVVKEGGSIALAPEGNRTYSGHTCYIKPAIASLIMKLGLPLVIYRIEGGYGVEPRWSDAVRKGKMHSYIRKVIEPEEYKNLSKDEFIELIRREMYVDEGVPGGYYPCSNAAEYMERAFYTCPSCGLTTWKSIGDLATCETCGGTIRYSAEKEIEEVNPFPEKFPYTGTSEWYRAQEDFVRKLDLAKYETEPMYTDDVQAFRVVPYRNKVLLARDAEMKLFGNRVEVGGESWSYDDIKGMSCMGHNKLNIIYKEDMYQIRGDKRFNALKYLHVFYHYEANKKGDNDDEFLGL